MDLQFIEFDDNLVVNPLSDIEHKSMPYLIAKNEHVFIIKRSNREIAYSQNNKGIVSVFGPFMIKYKDILIPDLVNIEVTIEYLNENKHILVSMIKVIHMLDSIENKIAELQGYRFGLTKTDIPTSASHSIFDTLYFVEIPNMELMVENDELMITYPHVIKIPASILENTGCYGVGSKKINLNYTYNLFLDIYYLIKDIITRTLYTYSPIKSAR